MTFSHSLWKILLLAAVWAGVVLFVLSFREIEGEWDHAACGVWGCAPPLAAVATMQILWGLVFFPIGYWLERTFSRCIVRTTGATVLAVAVCGLTGIVIYEYFHWYSHVNPDFRQYFGRRLALSILTQIDFPVVILLLSGGILYWRSRKGDELDQLLEVEVGGGDMQGMDNLTI